MAGPNGLRDATWDSAVSASLRFGSTKVPFTKFEPSEIEIKLEKVRRAGAMLADKRTPGVAELSDGTVELLWTDYEGIVLPRMPENGGTLTEFVILVQLSHPSVLGSAAILLDRVRLVKLGGPTLEASEKALIAKMSYSAMARHDKGSDGKWKALDYRAGRPSSTAVALMKF